MPADSPYVPPVDFTAEELSRYGSYDNQKDFERVFGSAALKSTNDDHWALNYEPRQEMVAFHQRHQRYAFLICHRRYGKTVACIAELVIRALYTKKKQAQYAYVCPFRTQAKAVAWNYLVEMTQGVAIDVKVSELSVTLPNGAKIWLTGSDNVNALRGLYLDGVVLDEFGQSRPDLLEAVIMPCLLDRKGWLVIIGTAYGRLNKFFDYYEKSRDDDEWFHADIKVADSNVIPLDEQRRIRDAISEAKWNQEFQNDFSAELVGTYYASLVNDLEQRQKINTTTVWDVDLPVQVAFDIGRSDNTCAWFFQETAHGIKWIDFYTNNGESASHYIDMLKDKPYNLSRVHLPHDAKAMTFSTDKSALEQFVHAFEHQDTLVGLVPKLSVADGIEAARQVLKHSEFNGETCYYGIECLRVYRKKFDEINQVFSNKPLHDYSSDAADAFRYASIMANKSYKPAPSPHESIAAQIRSGGEYQLENLFSQRESANKKSFIAQRRV
tara:strand:+ start:1031 stop:2518 length:1488 start_codon:yes stop_codon:yes gene_type:complete